MRRRIGKSFKVNEFCGFKVESFVVENVWFLIILNSLNLLNFPTNIANNSRFLAFFSRFPNSDSNHQNIVYLVDNLLTFR